VIGLFTPVALIAVAAPFANAVTVKPVMVDAESAGTLKKTRASALPGLAFKSVGTGRVSITAADVLLATALGGCTKTGAAGTDGAAF
jgi:hypothetical protein